MVFTSQYTLTLRLLVGIFHLSVGSGSYGLSVNCERASTFKQESLRAKYSDEEVFHAGSGSVVRAHDKADTGSTYFGDVFLILPFLVIGM